MRQPIICALDYSPQAAAAAQVAAQLARRLGAPLALAHVADDRAVAHADLLQAVADDVSGHDDVRTSVLRGKPAHALLEAASAWHAGMIVAGARGRPGLARAVVGTVSGELAATAPCPVVVVRAADAVGDPDGPVVCAVDADAPAQRGVRVAGLLAAGTGAPVEVVHAYGPGGAAALPAGVGAEVLDHVALDARAGRAATALAARAAAPLGAAARPAAVAARPSIPEALADYAAGHGASLVVVGSRGRRPLAAAVLGSLTSDLLAISPCPVVVVPPSAAAAALGAARGQRQSSAPRAHS